MANCYRCLRPVEGNVISDGRRWCGCTGDEASGHLQAELSEARAALVDAVDMHELDDHAEAIRKAREAGEGSQ